MKVMELPKVVETLRKVIFEVRGIATSSKELILENEKIINDKFNEISAQVNSLKFEKTPERDECKKERNLLAVGLIEKHQADFDNYNKGNEQFYRPQYNAHFPEGVQVPPQHLDEWREVVDGVYEKYPNIKKENEDLKKREMDLMESHVELLIKKIPLIDTTNFTTNEYNLLKFMIK